MINNTLVTSTSTTVPELVFTSSSTGEAISPPTSVGEIRAITTISLCNVGTPDINDESVDTCNVSLYIVRNGNVPGTDNTIISELTIPAGETVFLSDEKFILDEGDELHVGTSAASLISVTVSTIKV